MDDEMKGGRPDFFSGLRSAANVRRPSRRPLERPEAGQPVPDLLGACAIACGLAKTFTNLKWRVFSSARRKAACSPPPWCCWPNGFPARDAPGRAPCGTCASAGGGGLRAVTGWLLARTGGSLMLEASVSSGCPCGDRRGGHHRQRLAQVPQGARPGAFRAGNHWASSTKVAGNTLLSAAPRRKRALQIGEGFRQPAGDGAGPQKIRHRLTSFRALSAGEMAPDNLQQNVAQKKIPAARPFISSSIARSRIWCEMLGPARARHWSDQCTKWCT